MTELFIEDLGKVVGGQSAPDLTTEAVGEEGAPPLPTDPPLTTQALGEEGAPPLPPTDGGDRGGRGPDLTTFALGEEGGPFGF